MSTLRGGGLDVSVTGIFIQTGAKVAAGDVVDLEVMVPGSSEPISMAGEVVREKRVPPHLRAIAKGGIGIRIVNTREAYYRFMQGLAGVGNSEDCGTADRSSSVDAPIAENVKEPEPAYQVRVKQPSGPRSKRILVQAQGIESAREEAIKQIGEGWPILEVSAAPL